MRWKLGFPPQQGETRVLKGVFLWLPRTLPTLSGMEKRWLERADIIQRFDLISVAGNGVFWWKDYAWVEDKVNGDLK